MPQITTSRSYSLISALLAFLIWGGWAFYINQGFSGGEHAAISGLTQGSCSLVITLLMTQSVVFQYNYFPSMLGKICLPPLLTVLVTGSLLVGIHLAIGTPAVIYTVLPALCVALLFNIFTVYQLHCDSQSTSEAVKQPPVTEPQHIEEMTMKLDQPEAEQASTDSEQGLEGRRPLKVRNAGLAHWIARWLSGKSITPNQISIASVLFAALAALCLLIIPVASGIFSILLPIFAALFIQCRLLCNLFDGMVAVEGGKGTASGELYNDIPDRIADPLIIVAAGYAITVVAWASPLGWFAAILAVMTAYVRTLAVSIGAPASFAGPMAKQHRMAIMTVACVISAVEAYYQQPAYALLIALLVIAVGCLITLYRRTRAAYYSLENGQ